MSGSGSGSGTSGGNGSLDRGDLPRAFGRYRLLAALGRGGMGEVFAARVEEIDKLCVVKTLPRELGLDREAVARFSDEARLVVKLNQRNIVSVFDVGVHDGLHYLAMDLVHGRDLRTIWRMSQQSGKPLDPGLAIHIIAEILDGLDYAHRLAEPGRGPLKIVHRDVSPQNIMVSFEGDVKLIDFGLAASTLKVEKTESNVVMGKVAYMPPEQVHGEAVDARADIFAAAVTLYELLVGERYYEGIAPLLVSASAASGAHRPKKLDVLEPALRDIIVHATAPVGARTDSAARLAEELRAYAAARGLRGDASTLRRMMVDLFGASPEPWQASSSSSSFPSPAPTLTTSTSAPSPPASAPARVITHTALVVEPTARTERIERAAGVRRSRAVPIAAAAGVLIVATLVVVAIDRRGAGGAAAVDAGAAAAPAVPIAAVAARTATGTAATAGVAEVPAADAGAPLAVVPVTTSAATAPPIAPASPDEAKRAEHPRSTSRALTPRAKRPSPERLEAQRSPLTKADYIVKHCPSLACARTLKSRDLAAPGAMDRFTRDVDACFARCEE